MTELNTGNNSEQRQDGQREPTKFWPAIINVINSYAANQRAQAEKRNNPLSRRIGYWTRFGAISTGIGALLAFAAALIFWLQLEDARQAFADGNRAWIKTEDPNLNGPAEIKPGVQMRIEEPYRNIGKTPALNVAYWAEATWVDARPINNEIDVSTLPIPPNRACKMAESGRAAKTGVVYPEQSYHTSADASTTVIFPPEVMVGRKLLVVQGCFVYDSFETPRHSAHCHIMLLGNPIKWGLCSGAEQNFAN